MDLEFSPDELELRDNVRTVLAGLCPPSLVRSVFEGKSTPDALWARMVELDWPAIAIPERFGGIGGTFVDVVIVAEELGRAVAPGPLLATVTQFVPAVRELVGDDRAEQVLRPVAAGERTGTLAVAEDGRWDVTAVSATGRRVSGRCMVAGAKCSVVDGGSADDVVVVARG